MKLAARLIDSENPEAKFPLPDPMSALPGLCDALQFEAKPIRRGRFIEPPMIIAESLMLPWMQRLMDQMVREGRRL